ncbi:Aste57867_14656 [Aphanomyces stellatus]|uniref:3-dehydrosphinganine reductase n=1 Tax=Aphanomyces stellatus TaxID=120398 RepID=A0A485L185_9STRA|nr:hypothetical protein As57867_014601 [Aphanomyces stellatus]VFT91475.1 Aste57867_14656 [Aphanomyces stellatus]
MTSSAVGLVLFLVLAVPVAVLVIAAAATAWIVPLFRKRMDFREKHVFITGGSQGLGKELALQWVDQGANVTIVARHADTLQAVVELVDKSPSSSKGKMAFAVADVTDPASLAAAVDASPFGAIDILVCNAGSSSPGYMMKTDASVHRALMDLNYFGALNTVHAVLPTMLARQRGTILFIASAAALTSYIGYSAYSPTKYAMRGLADCLRSELAACGIAVHIAFPGSIDTPLFAAEALTKPKECVAIEASEVVYQARDIAASILSDLQHGVYAMTCIDFGIRLLGVMGGGMAPRANPALDILLFPVALVVAWVVRGQWDRHAASATW